MLGIRVQVGCWLNPRQTWPTWEYANLTWMKTKRASIWTWTQPIYNWLPGFVINIYIYIFIGSGNETFGLVNLLFKGYKIQNLSLLFLYAVYYVFYYHIFIDKLDSWLNSILGSPNRSPTRLLRRFQNLDLTLEEIGTSPTQISLLVRFDLAGLGFFHPKLYPHFITYIVSCDI